MWGYYLLVFVFLDFVLTQLMLKVEGCSQQRSNIQTVQYSSNSSSPWQEVLETNENVHVETNKLVTTHLNHKIGIEETDGFKVLADKKHKKHMPFQIPLETHSDLISSRRNSKLIQPLGSIDATVEVVLICSKEFGDLFKHDRKKILEYFTVYFWDVNLRFKTLPTNNISFRITGVKIISTVTDQPFIEEARDEEGHIVLSRMLEKFSFWIYGKMSSLPKFDIAIAIALTRSKYGWSVELAKSYFATACKVDDMAGRHWGTVVLQDDGGWGTVLHGTRELAHTLGAMSEQNTLEDSCFPGPSYIMSQRCNDLLWYFSPSSDTYIGEFLRSDKAACLRILDANSTNPVIRPDFSAVLAPTMIEQCRRRTRNEKSRVSEDSLANCKSMTCLQPLIVGGSFRRRELPVDNSPCLKGGRCFRGKCRQQGYLIKNVASGLCMRATIPFSHQADLDMVPCTNRGTALDRFIITKTGNGTTFATPFSTLNAKEIGDKCICTGTNDGGKLWAERCNYANPYQTWNLIYIEEDQQEVLLSHRATKMCAKPNGGYIRSYKKCDKNDRRMLWKLQL